GGRVCVTRGGDPVTHGNGDRVWRLAHAAGDDPGRGGVLVADVLQTAVADQHDSAQVGLVAVGCFAPVAAHRAVIVDVALVAAVGAPGCWAVQGLGGLRYGDPPNLG